METITFLNNACHLSDSESGSKAGTSPLMSDLWGKVIPVRTLMWYHMGWRRGKKKKTIALNLFYHHVALSAGLANVFAFMLGVCFLLLCIASDPDDPLTRLLFLCVCVCYNERLK